MNAQNVPYVTTPPNWPPEVVAAYIKWHASSPDYNTPDAQLWMAGYQSALVDERWNA